MRCRIAGLEFELIYLIKDDNDVMLSMRFRTSSNSVALAVGQNCGGRSRSMSNITYGWNRSYVTADNEYSHFSGKILGCHRTFYEGVVYNTKVDNGYIFSTEKDVTDDLFYYLYDKFALPLMTEWKEFLYTQLSAENAVKKVWRPCVVADGYGGKETCSIVHGDKEISSDELFVLDAQGVSEEILTKVISQGLRDRKIFIDNETHKIMPPLQVSGINEYMERFSESICASLKKNNLRPKVKAKKRDVDGLALLSRKLYAPQADSTNGIIAAMDAGDNYVFVSEEMGCGKTIQAASAVEALYNQLWLRQHPGKTLKDCFLSGEVAYRVVVMCPAHLCTKWKHEVESQIPGARGIIVRDLSQLEELRKLNPKMRIGKEFWIFSKEVAKADTIKRPVPTTMVKKVPAVSICYDCLKNSTNEGNESHRKILSKKAAWGAGELGYGNLRKSPMVIKDGVPTCVTCGGHNGHLVELNYPYAIQDREGVTHTFDTYKGLKCPCCDNLLLKNGSQSTLVTKRVEDFDKYVLTVGSFATKTTANESCHVCGASLWEDNVEPLNIPLDGEPSPITPKQDIVYDENGVPEIVEVEEVKKWVKIKVCPDEAKKRLTDPKKRICSNSYYALIGHESETVAAKGVGSEFVYSKKEYGPRRFSPARYVKRYLRGYFDMLIADEAHLYEGDKTEQAMALHWLMKAVKFTMLLTGTLTNGSAGSLFNIHFMVNPKRMKELGFSFNKESSDRFSEIYGVVERKFECSQNGRGEYNAQGKGKQLGKARVKPGISPLIYPDLLLNHTVQLNISDMSNKLPPLNEHVVIVDMNADQKAGYEKNIDSIKYALKNPPLGAGMLGKMLQLGLSYPDKPYGRSDVYSLKVADALIVSPDNLAYYEECEHLLPKGEKLIEIINQEIAEGRPCFVYTEYSSSEETDIEYRLQEIIESHCNLKGQVSVLKSKSVKAMEREEYIKRNSDKVKVFITNYRNVETGIDFVGEYEGRSFNYPTIIFFQVGMSLSSVWQASRRHYRLNQTKECRTYYLTYKNTFQLDMLEMMSKKMSAASAIQGNFSESALENMAGSEDPTVVLAKKIMSGQTGGAADANNIEEQLSMTRNLAISACDESLYIGNEPVTYYDVVGENVHYQSAMVVEEVRAAEEVTASETQIKDAYAEKTKTELLASIGDFFAEMAVIGAEDVKQVKKKATRPVVGQVTLFAFA